MRGKTILEFGRLHKRTFYALCFLLAFSITLVFATPPTSSYNPGETLDPNCAPGDANCTVLIFPDQTGNAGKYLSTDGTNVSWQSTASGLTLQTNGTTNGSQSTLNLAAGSNVTLTDNGGGTVTIAAAGGGWSLTGNAGTTPGTNFIGTTDNQPLYFKVNNTLAGQISPSTFGSVSLGVSSIPTTATGSYNVAIGSGVLSKDTSGYGNIAIGHSTLYNNTTGHDNTGLGYLVMGFNTSGVGNTAVGSRAMNQGGATLHSGGSYNTALGYSALAENWNNNYNVGVGYYAGYNSTGSSITSVGPYSGLSTTASYSVLLGNGVADEYSGGNGHIGNNNIIIGNYISLPNTTANAINIGGVLFGSGTQSDTTATNPHTTVQTAGKIGIDVLPADQTATLNVSGTAAQAPFRITSTTAPTTSNNGDLYYDGTHLYFDISGSNYQLDQQSGASYTASNGLTLSGSDVQLGGTLTGYTTINTGSNSLQINSNAASSTTILNISNTASNGAGIGINTDGTALMTSSTSAYALYTTSTAPSDDTPGNIFIRNNTTTNSIAKVISISRQTSGTASSGIGTSIDYGIQNSTGSQISSNALISKLTNATSGSETSEFSITGVNSGTTATLFTLSGSGAAKLNKYGAGTFTGTPTHTLQVDAGGNVIEGAIGGTWSLTGNSGTTAGTNFIGTTDNVSLEFRTNNERSGWIDRVKNNTGFGRNTMPFISGTASGNSIFGAWAGYSLSTGSNNTAVGNSAILNLTTGSGNTVIGTASLSNSTNSSNVVAIGSNAMSSATSSYGIGIGNFSLANDTGGFNVGVGYYALSANTSGNSNIGIGYYAMMRNTTGIYNVSIGRSALGNVIGDYNVAIGMEAGLGVYSSSNVSSNVFIGYHAGYAVLTGADSNILIGTQAGDNLTSGAKNIIIGSNISAPSATTSNQLNIGNIIFGSELTGTGTTIAGKIGIATIPTTYTLEVGNSSVAGIVAHFVNSTGYCDINPTTSSLLCSSDITLKKNITTLSDNSDFILNSTLASTNYSQTLDKLLLLTPVTYNWKSEIDGSAKHTGFIAQEVEQIFPDLVSTDSNGLKSLNYAGFTPILAQAIKEMNLKITGLNDVTKENSWRDAITSWLASATNGIQQIFAKKAHLEELCVKKSDGSEVCLNGDDVQNLLDNRTPIVINSQLTPTSPIESAQTDEKDTSDTSGIEDSNKESDQSTKDSTDQIDTNTTQPTQTPVSTDEDQNIAPENDKSSVPVDESPQNTQTIDLMPEGSQSSTSDSAL